jgi:segregation and condensation protein B
MNEFYIRNVVEAALLAAGKSLQLAELGQLFDENESARPKTEDLQAALEALAADYANRGLEVKETAAGFRIQVRKEFAAEISRLWPERPAKYSRALLETLALIAYRQPITRAEIEAVRGVAVNPNIVKTVIERNWVRVVGHRDVPGRPELLGTTREFLDYFGLRSLDELPALADVKALGDYNLQLELPNASVAEGSEGAAVAGGLLTNEAGGETAGGETAAGEGSPEGVAPGVEGVATESASSGEVTAEGADAVAPLATVEGFTRVESVMAEGGDAEAVASASAAVETAAGEVATDAIATEGTTAEAEDTTHAEHDAVATPEIDATSEVDGDAEAERTLDADSASQHTTESDESEASESNTTKESLETLDDASEEDADEDELSADGHGSREMVAAPRDSDD